MSALSNTRNLTLDVLRGGAILYIVGYYHIQKVWLIRLPHPLEGWLARVALGLFCFISGYLLTKNLQMTKWSEVLPFYRRRLLRIYPLYFIALVGFIYFKIVPENQFWPSVFMVNTLIGRDILTLWFVSMIFLFYVVTPLYLLRRSDAKIYWLTMCFLTLLLVGHYVFGWVDMRIIPNFITFAFGILISQKEKANNWFLSPSIKVWLTSLLLTIVVGYITLDNYPRDDVIASILGMVAWFFVSLPFLFGAARWLSDRLPIGLISFFATGSFVLYLSHRIVYRFGESLWCTDGLTQQLYFLLVLLPLAAIFSYYLQTFYQRLVK